MRLFLTLVYDRRQRGGQLKSREDLREAMLEGAAKRLRPKPDDRGHDDHRLGSGALEHGHGSGRDEVHRWLDDRWTFQLVPARAQRLSRGFRDLERARVGSCLDLSRFAGKRGAAGRSKKRTVSGTDSRNREIFDETLVERHGWGKNELHSHPTELRSVGVLF
jgi:hypothetical protein